MIRDFLKSLGIEVLEASNATEAIHTARSHTGTIDLLLNDVEMPGMSGWDLAPENRWSKAWHSHSLHIRCGRLAGKGQLRGKAGWSLLHSKTVSVGGI